MTFTCTKIERAGHPWDGAARPEFDHLYVQADTQAEMDAGVLAAKAKFWEPWLIGTNEETGLPGGVMFKPTGINAPWSDSPTQKHPGGIESIDRMAYRAVDANMTSYDAKAQKLGYDSLALASGAPVDVAWLKGMTNPAERHHVAVMIQRNMDAYPAYSAHLQNECPDVMAELKAAGEEDQRRILAKL